MASTKAWESDSYMCSALKEMEGGLRLFKFWLGIWNRCARLHVCSPLLACNACQKSASILVCWNLEEWKNEWVGTVGCCLVTSIWVGFQELCVELLYAGQYACMFLILVYLVAL